MNLHYCANTLPGTFCLPTQFVENCTPEALAELAAADHWRDHPDDTPTLVTVVHLHNVDGHDLGVFEVHCEQRRVYTAHLLTKAVTK